MPKRVHDLTGLRFGRLVVASMSDPQPGTGSVQWLARCDCGQSKIVLAKSLKSGNTKSCGCRKRAAGAVNLTTHGLSKTRAHGCWKAAKQRCFNPNADNYRHYGGRGITMAAVWADDFARFYADMGECPPGHTLDRIRVSGNYEPGNCRWATQATQVRNTRRNILVDAGGATMVLKDFAAGLGVSDGAMRYRMLTYGETPQEAGVRLLERLPRRQNTAPGS